MYQTCQLPIFHNANLPLPEMLHCISESVGLQINILLICIKLVGRIAYYHRGHIALKHGSDWNIPMSEFHLASVKVVLPLVPARLTGPLAGLRRNIPKNLIPPPWRSLINKF